MIRFFCHNSIAANLLMWTFIILGILAWSSIPKQFFPEVTPEKITINIRYPGVDAAEIEKAVIRRIEEKMKGLDEIDKIESFVTPETGLISLFLKPGVDEQELLQDVKNNVDQIRSDLPEGIEEPEIKKVARQFSVMSLFLSGKVSEIKLRREALRIRDELLTYPQINNILMIGIRDREIWIEVLPAKLIELGISIEEVAVALNLENKDITGGELKNENVSIQVKSFGENRTITHLENKVVRSNPDGSRVLLKDLATLSDNFHQNASTVNLEQDRSCRIAIMKTENQDLLQMANIVNNYLAKSRMRLADGLQIKVIVNSSRFLTQRLNLMWRNAWMGFILVLFSLWIFLEFRVAFWVAVGVPVACLATFIGMYYLSISINLMSLLGIILVLGMLVDDAVVVGENIFRLKMEGNSWSDAATMGAGQVIVPVVTAVATTIVAFIPLLFITGTFGEWVSDIPKVVVLALAMSLMEVFFILPAHLGHSKDKQGDSFFRRLEMAKIQFFSKVLPQIFASQLKWLLRWRYVVISMIFGASIAILSLVVSNKVPFIFVQKLDSEYVVIELEMLPGTSRQQTQRFVTHMTNIARQLPEVENVFSSVGGILSTIGRQHSSPTIAEVYCELLQAEERQKKGMRTAQECAAILEKQIPRTAQIKDININVVTGLPTGKDLEIQVAHDSYSKIAEVVRRIRQQMNGYPAISFVSDDLQIGQPEVQVKLRPHAKNLGLTTSDIALQIRYALFGLEAQRFQDGDDEVTLRILFPQKARANISDLEKMRIMTAKGAVTISEVANLQMGRGNTVITKIDGKKTATITANVDENQISISKLAVVLENHFRDIRRQFPNISITFAGRKKQMQESFAALKMGFPIALFFIYAFIAVAFRSYTQPIIIMIVIPFSVIGAIWGHFVMGFPFTFMSIIGCVALAGVVVNDNLVLIDFVNRLRREGHGIYTAVVTGAEKRFRAILLTSITTVIGLVPLLSDRSFQAATIVPMAISLAFGLIFATLLTLVMVPALYLVLEDIKALFSNGKNKS